MARDENIRAELGERYGAELARKWFIGDRVDPITDARGRRMRAGDIVYIKGLDRHLFTMGHVLGAVSEDAGPDAPKVWVRFADDTTMEWWADDLIIERSAAPAVA